MMEGPGADSEEKHEPVSDIGTAVVVVGLKALDPEWPIREANEPTATFVSHKSSACPYLHLPLSVCYSDPPRCLVLKPKGGGNEKARQNTRGTS